VILTYAVLYTVLRFSIEFVRDDPRGDILGITTLTGLSTSQLISLLVGITGFLLLAVRARYARRAAHVADTASPART
jgi:prolipoprotein diacylglyceryltransferase